MTFEYLSFEPETGETKKLAFIFHGYGVNASYVRKIAWEMQAQIDNLTVIAPQAPEIFKLDESSNDGFLPIPQQFQTENDNSADHYSSERRMWFGIETNDVQVMTDRMSLITQRLNHFMDRKLVSYELSSQDLAITGFSQGGAVALIAAYSRPEPVACVIAHSTLFFQSPLLVSKSPTLFVYGNNDEEFSVSRYQHTIKELRDYNHDFETVEIDGLRHKTNDESRNVMARYLKKRFSV